jgi:gluconokinase
MVATIVVMGVSGSGKTTVARAIAQATGWVMAEGDEFHPPENVAKMRSGHPLDDEDRWPWLRRIADWIGEQERTGTSSVITCSALRRSYRDLLRDGHPSVRFCWLDADAETIRDRIGHRSGHYMPAALLDSQLATLEPLQPDEGGARVDVSMDTSRVLRDALSQLGLAPVPD